MSFRNVADQLTDNMKVIHFTQPGAPSVLSLKEIDTPIPGPHDVLVKIKAAGINPVDTKIRQGKFPASDVTGFDASGVVELVGKLVANVSQGDEVFYAGHLGKQGSMAQYNVIDSRLIANKPRRVSFTDAAAFPLVSLTAWETFVDHFGLIPLSSIETLSGKQNANSMLIINGAGGVGSIATQLARRVFKLKNVIVTASREETIAHAKEMGATHVVNHHEPLKAQIEALGIEEVKYIMICHDTQMYLSPACELAAPYGRIASIVETDAPLQFQSMAAFSKALSFSWSFMMARPTSGFNMDAQGRILKQVAKLIDAGVLTSIATQTSVLSVVGLIKAHEQIESGTTIGKIVFEVCDDIL